VSRELRELKTLEEARRVLLAALPPRLRQGRFPGRPTDLAAAVGHPLADPITAPADLPPFDRSLVDGYAVRAADTFGASEGLPAYLELAGEVPMGAPAEVPLSANQCARIRTGGMLPPYADAVVMVEHTQPWGERSVEVLRPVAPGANVVRRGDDARAGDAILPAGHRLRPRDISALAGLGFAQVSVARPRVAVLSTGDELVPPTASPAPGQVRDMNGPALRAAAAALGAGVLDLGIVPDERAALHRALARGVEEADIVLVSGGTSVGAEDLVPEVIEDLGPPGVIIHGLALRPGKPAVVGLAGETPIFGLPGNPTSCLIIFRELVAPLLRSAAADPAPPLVHARLTRNLSSQAGRAEFVPVRLEQRDGDTVAVPLLGPSALILTLVRADGVIRIPEAAEGLEAGELVTVEPLE